ncbi:TonB-dependent receptor [Paraferrimonas sp. SM1919]|uniref:TonB-dependent receptor n=1 Tax=Paraferrimonas sp. SM1919 TaxID=2662263 RepID=UPI0013D08A5C|nr:TonB-dependent receptor [Paraferrimonas sp. SM1919]
MSTVNSGKKFSKKQLAVVIPLLISSATFADEQADLKDIELEVITVTSQKRAQNLQEVPVAVTAVSGDALAEQAIKDIIDLKAYVPALNVQQSQTAAHSNFSLRGVGTSSQNWGTESSVGLYIDGVYRPRQSALINNFVDVEAVEVLRGPQGTLFGKNTPSGAISIRSVAPDHQANGFIEVGLGNFNLKNFSGATNLSIVEDVLAFRVTGFKSNRDGTVSDVNFGENIYNDRNRYGLKAQMLYTPTDTLSLRVIADYGEIDEVCCAAGPMVSNFYKEGSPTEAGTDTIFAMPPFNATIIPDSQYDQRVVALALAPIAKMTDKGISAELQWDINSSWKMTSITAGRQYESFDYSNSSYIDLDISNRDNHALQKSFSQELRFDYTSEKFNAITGLYYFQNDQTVDSATIIGEDFNPFFMNFILPNAVNQLDPVLMQMNPQATPEWIAAQKQQLLGVFDGIDMLSMISGGTIAPAGIAGLSETSYNANSAQEQKSFAIFGQFDVALSDTTTLTAGLRWTKETKDMVNVFTEDLPTGAAHPDDMRTAQELIPNMLAAAGSLGAILADPSLLGSPALPQITAALAPFQQDNWGAQITSPVTRLRSDLADKIDDNQLTGTIKLSYQPNRTTLVYGSFGTGYKSGGMNTDRLAEGLDPKFKAEKSQAWEIGLKKDFPEQNIRTNIAAHITKVKDFQANAFIGDSFNLMNAGDYDTSGFEFEGTWLATELTNFNVMYAHTKATYASFEKGPCWNATPWHFGIQDPGQESEIPWMPNSYCNRKDGRPIGQPEDQLLVAAKQILPISDSIYSYAVLEYSLQGDLYTDGSNDPLSYRGSVGLWNARLNFNIESVDLDVNFWAKNIGNKKYFSQASFPGPLQPGKLYNFYAEPATYGVTIKKRF